MCVYACVYVCAVCVCVCVRVCQMYAHTLISLLCSYAHSHSLYPVSQKHLLRCRSGDVEGFAPALNLEKKNSSDKVRNLGENRRALGASPVDPCKFTPCIQGSIHRDHKSAHQVMLQLALKGRCPHINAGSALYTCASELCPQG